MPTASRNDAHHPHDAFFKEIFSDLANARPLIARYAPPELVRQLGLNTHEPYGGSFVDDELGQHFADLVFRAKSKQGNNTFVCLLFEHKSYPDRWVALQLLRYIILVWVYLAKSEPKLLPMVFPMVVYHGKRKWRIKRDLHALVDLKGLESLRQYVPNFEYHLLDLNVLADESLSEAELMNVALGVMKHIFDSDIKSALGRIFGQLRAMSATDRARSIKIILNYIATSAAHLAKADISRVLVDNDNDKLVEEGLMTLAQQWMLEGKQVGLIEGELRGKQVGLIEGKQTGLLEVNKRLIRRRFREIPEAVFQALERLDAEQLSNFSEAMFDFADLNQAQAWLTNAQLRKTV
ncbi:MAG: Rpn family recombination-promoting nuclease/putative transposase [Anaerolineae bacterium]|nr:Rpn family recombination-promoting nuclease/putative transposase [Anaerolineae bacterium]